MIVIIFAISISAYADDKGSYSNGTDMYSNDTVELYSNIDDEYDVNMKQILFNV